ncbi:hypothetical protein VOWphi5012_055 [Vibrio phage phi50-12]|uniref:Uncharacterized protein n=1 Tax=Vibrio phage phi50-12 TaxID=2654972 RepID=A0A5P8PRE5_9CAUD|nr:hypothetical protein KNU82_gp055 [Vibrio phage phi50-12]QFR59839.1 hypothetical protein VOWphi5012_055 [Vibrio phage phi50-12]
MNTFERNLIVMIIICFASLTGLLSHIYSKQFTCEQLGKELINGQCVQLEIEEKQ